MNSKLPKSHSRRSCSRFLVQLYFFCKSGAPTLHHEAPNSYHLISYKPPIPQRCKLSRCRTRILQAPDLLYPLRIQPHASLWLLPATIYLPLLRHRLRYSATEGALVLAISKFAQIIGEMNFGKPSDKMPVRGLWRPGLFARSGDSEPDAVGSVLHPNPTDVFRNILRRLCKPPHLIVGSNRNLFRREGGLEYLQRHVVWSWHRQHCFWAGQRGFGEDGDGSGTQCLRYRQVSGCYFVCGCLQSVQRVAGWCGLPCRCA